MNQQGRFILKADLFLRIFLVSSLMGSQFPSCANSEAKTLNHCEVWRLARPPFWEAKKKKKREEKEVSPAPGRFLWAEKSLFKMSTKMIRALSVEISYQAITGSSGMISKWDLLVPVFKNLQTPDILFRFLNPKALPFQPPHPALGVPPSIGFTSRFSLGHFFHRPECGSHVSTRKDRI